MGMMNDAILSYLEDDERFADLFNYVYFGGEQIVKSQELREASEVYPSVPDIPGRTVCLVTLPKG